jgi:hypothetical protein
MKGGARLFEPGASKKRSGLVSGRTRGMTLVLGVAVMLVRFSGLRLHRLARGRGGIFGRGEARLDEGGAGDEKGEREKSGFHFSCSVFASRSDMFRIGPLNPP